MTTLTVISTEIECEGCTGSIERVLRRVDGVSTVIATVPDQRVVIEFDESVVDEAALYSALEGAGFPATAV